MSEIKYEAALAELQSIVSKMENDELDVDQMSVQLKRAQELIKFCKETCTRINQVLQGKTDQNRRGNQENPC